MERTEFRGTSLFNDIEDRALRNRNRGVVLANELERGFRKGKLLSSSAAFILGYFSLIPKGEKGETQENFVQFAKERGFEL